MDPNEIKGMIPLAVMIGVMALIKLSGFVSAKSRKVKRGYEEVRVDENGGIYITVKNKFLGFDRSNEYRLKYIRAEQGAEKEIKKFLDGRLLDEKYIFIPMDGAKLFSREKLALIFVRDCSEPFRKIPLRLLPQTEIQNIIIPMIRTGIAEAEPGDFTTLADMLAARKLKKMEGIEIPKLEKEKKNEEEAEK